jgi:hypothetical protein
MAAAQRTEKAPPEETTERGLANLSLQPGAKEAVPAKPMTPECRQQFPPRGAGRLQSWERLSWIVTWYGISRLAVQAKTWEKK